MIPVQKTGRGWWRQKDYATPLAARDAKDTNNAVVYRKATKAHHPGDWERWEEADAAPTLDAAGHAPRTATAVAFNVYPRAGQGADLEACETEVSDTLNPTALAKRTDRGTRVVGEWGVRRLTPRECERLQGFPDDWTRWGHGGEEIADTHRYRLLGNAVTVPVAHWIGRRIMRAEG